MIKLIYNDFLVHFKNFSFYRGPLLNTKKKFILQMSKVNILAFLKWIFFLQKIQELNASFLYNISFSFIKLNLSADDSYLQTVLDP